MSEQIEDHIHELKKCDKCDKRATHFARDMVEEVSDKGYREFRPSVKIKSGCADHPVESVKWELPK